MTLLDDLKWRYATKKMNGQIVPEDKLNYILKAAKLASSSSGSQPYQVFVITKKILLGPIRVFYNDPCQITDCSHLLVFAAWENYPHKWQSEHSAKQAYIGLGLAVAAAAEQKVDAIPMEGFDNTRMNKLLGLEKLGLKSVAILPIGYRDEGCDWLVNFKNVRKHRENFTQYYERPNQK